MHAKFYLQTTNILFMLAKKYLTILCSFSINLDHTSKDIDFYTIKRVRFIADTMVSQCPQVMAVQKRKPHSINQKK